MAHRIAEKWGSLAFWAGWKACDQMDPACTHVEIYVGQWQAVRLERIKDGATIERLRIALDSAFALGRDNAKAELRAFIGIY